MPEKKITVPSRHVGKTFRIGFNDGLEAAARYLDDRAERLLDIIPTETLTIRNLRYHAAAIRALKEKDDA